MSLMVSGSELLVDDVFHLLIDHHFSYAELPGPQIDPTLTYLTSQLAATQLNTTSSTDMTSKPETNPYFNSVWENISTRTYDDPYEKTSLENSDTLNIALFNPSYSHERATTLPIDLASIMRRPATERDLDVGTTTLSLFTRSRMYDLYDPYAIDKLETGMEDENDRSALMPTGRAERSTLGHPHGSGNDPIEIDDISPPSEVHPTNAIQVDNNSGNKSRKRPYPQESPAKQPTSLPLSQHRKIERKGSSSAGKAVVPLRKGKTKKE
jgi:hypothetical protein